MHTEAQESNNYLFENSFSFVSAEGALTQKNNSLFEGKVLKTGVTDNFEEHLNPFVQQFEELKKTIHSKLESAETVDETLKNELFDLMKSSESIGDFDGLKTAIESAPTTPNPEDDKKAVEESKAEEVEPDEEAAKETVEATVETTEQESPEHAEKKEEDVTAETTEDKAPAEVVEESKEEVPEETEKASEEPAEEEVDDTPIGFFKALAKKAEEISESKNWQSGFAEFDEIESQWGEGPAVDESDTDKLLKLRQSVDKAKEVFTERRTQHYKELQERREKNLARREELIVKAEKIVANKRWQAQGDINSIQRKFENIRPLPNEGVEEQNTRLAALIAQFDENRVEYLVKVRQEEEENLMGKLAILEKMEKIVADSSESTISWKQHEEDMEKFAKQWRKIGRVPKEKEEETWVRFRKAENDFLERRFEFDVDFKKFVDSNMAKREKLISKAESLTEADDLLASVMEMSRLHREWKKLDNLPQKMNDETWKRFKEASDKFNDFKSENADAIKEQEQKNYDEKIALCEKAEALAATEDFRKTGNKMEMLFEEWKKTGTVSRKKSNATWKRFRKAMESFYENRRAYFKKQREEQQANADKKQSIISQITELAKAEDMKIALEAVKKLQDEFKQIGFVPIRQKDKLWNSYRKACDVFFDAYRKSTGNTQAIEAGGGYTEPSAIKKVHSELFRLRKEADKLRDEALKYNDTKTYFKPNKKGMKLINEIQNNIDAAEAKLEKVNNRISELQAELESLKNTEE